VNNGQIAYLDTTKRIVYPLIPPWPNLRGFSPKSCYLYVLDEGILNPAKPQSSNYMVDLDHTSPPSSNMRLISTTTYLDLLDVVEHGERSGATKLLKLCHGERLGKPKFNRLCRAFMWAVNRCFPNAAGHDGSPIFPWGLGTEKGREHQIWHPHGEIGESSCPAALERHGCPHVV